MTLELLTIKQKLCVTIDSNTEANIIPVFSYIPYAKLGYNILDEYLEINDLKAVAWIYNLAAITFPIFELEDTESKQLLAAINLEWKSPRIQLDIMCKIDSLPWQKIQAFSLLNPDPYPYREYSLGNHTLGNNAMIGVKITDVGYGFLKSTATGEDKVTVFADLIRQITVDKPDVPVIVNVTGGGLTPTPTPTVEDDEMPLKIISADYTLENRDRIFAKNDIEGVGNFTLSLPLNPIEGFEVEIICCRNYQNKQVFISPGTLLFFGNGHSPNEIFLDDQRRGGKILFTHAEGWIPFPGLNPNFAINSSNN